MTSKSDFPVPETSVLAISSHVYSFLLVFDAAELTELRHVGNTMATIVMQSLGCDVAAINTVQFSNHLGYGQVKGTHTSSSEIIEIWKGLKDLHLDDFHLLLSGFLPDPQSVDAMALIGRELRAKNKESPGRFFWVVDPIMGDNGKLYVSESMVPAYKSVLQDTDLILPNHFEAEYDEANLLSEIQLTRKRTLSGVKIDDEETLRLAISIFHSRFAIPHVLITSLALNYREEESSFLYVAGSSMTSSKTPRIFIIKIPRIDCQFSGTGDMFGALILVRLREAVLKSPGLENTPNWLSNDDVPSTILPLAKAAEKAAAGIHEVLCRSKARQDVQIAAYQKKIGSNSETSDGEAASNRQRWVKAKASEVQIVRNLQVLKEPAEIFKAGTL
ncbi:hypothetical protein Golomagni_00073 [Golovinomyces magnicellulatus]|nr:hypothetical protein Golomagni_00073 [Golovinomyces magnicellulatus]